MGGSNKFVNEAKGVFPLGRGVFNVWVSISNSVPSNSTLTAYKLCKSNVLSIQERLDLVHFVATQVLLSADCSAVMSGIL